MALSAKTKMHITEILTTTVKEKLQDYKPETEYVPFHYRLLGKDRYAMFSFVQSMNTTFGMSIWEQVAVALAEGSGIHAQRHIKL
ncbi:MAG: TdeIII family type II restriction endonuclease, partial [Candidatus Omnitrophica bacterium]|nr:TdeIII family type II restriction endonuclease [Candidatus Omnitrophota bacterium]